MPEAKELLGRLADFEQDQGDLKLAMEGSTLADLQHQQTARRIVNRQLDDELLGKASEEADVSDINIRSPKTENHFHPHTLSVLSRFLPLALAAALGGVAGIGAMALSGAFKEAAPAPLGKTIQHHEGFLIELVPPGKKP